MANWLHDLINTLSEGMVANKFGPDFRQKQQAGQLALQQGQLGLQKTQGEIEGQGIENRIGEERIPLVRSQAEGAGLDVQSKQQALGEIQNRVRLAQEAFDRGEIGSPDLVIAKAKAESEAAKLGAENVRGNIALDAARTTNELNRQPHERSLANIRANDHGGSGGNAIGPTVTVYRNGRAVVLDRRTGEEVGEARPREGEVNSEKLAQSVMGALNRSVDLVRPKPEGSSQKPLTSGWDGMLPVGAASKLKQKVFGPEGDEGEFDALMTQLPNMIYLLSGKAINASESARLQEILPSRAKGKLDQQLRYFIDYANRLLTQYGQPPIPTDQLFEAAAQAQGQGGTGPAPGAGGQVPAPPPGFELVR